MGEPPVANSNGSAQSESQHSPGRKKPRPRRRLFHEVSLPGLASYNNLIGPLSPHESWATAPALQLTYTGPDRLIRLTGLAGGAYGPLRTRGSVIRLCTNLCTRRDGMLRNGGDAEVGHRRSLIVRRGQRDRRRRPETTETDVVWLITQRRLPQERHRRGDRESWTTAGGEHWRCGWWKRWPSGVGGDCCGSCLCGGSAAWPHW